MKVIDEATGLLGPDDAPVVKSTAKTGNPTEASRGAAVTRAKQKLGDAIDAKMQLDIEAMELAILARVVGVPVASVRARLDGATLAELEAWTRAITTPLAMPPRRMRPQAVPA